MSRGGGGGGGTNYADLEIDQRRRDDAERERQRAEEAAAARRTQYYQTVDRTRDNLTSRAREVLSQRGLDTNEFMPQITNAFYRRGAGIAEGDMNFANYFDDDFINNTLAQTRDNRRQRFTTQVANTFAPNSENNLFTYDMDDPITSSILGTQREDAQNMLTRAQARGNLDASGFSRGLQRIGELEQAGRAEADKIGNAIIDEQRTRLRGIAGRASSDASAYDLGRQFSIDPYKQEWDTTATTLRNNLEGAVRSGLEGQQFFDLGDLITRAGIAQGAQNPTSSQADEIARRMIVRNAERGTGASTGGGTF